MAVWPILLGLSAVVAGVALVAGKGRYIVPALAILACYLMVRAFVAVGVPSPSSIYAMIWLVAATGIIAHNWKNYGISTMLTASALCYLWAKAAGVSAAFGVLPFVFSDLFALAAMVVIGGGAWCDFVGRIVDLVSRRSGRRADFHSGGAVLYSGKAAKKAGR
jgi:predicted neutral ceramidase superfamily lipid hydrolase